MIVKCFFTSNDNRKINKSLTEIKQYKNVVCKDTIDMLNPIFLFNDFPQNCNYIYVVEWNKYYFVVNKNYKYNNMFVIECKIDVLTTYKNELLNCFCDVKASDTIINVDNVTTKYNKVKNIEKINMFNPFTSKTVVLMSINGNVIQ